MSLYDFHIFGTVDQDLLDTFRKRLFEVIGLSGIDSSEVNLFVDGADRGNWRDMKRPVAAIAFDAIDATDMVVVNTLVQRRAPIIPVFSLGKKPEDFPKNLQAINGLQYTGAEGQVDRIVQAVLDALGLLRQQRRVFISYRRSEATDTALQLHDHLSGLGYSVFLDTHSISAGEFFQSALWQNLCDSDVLIMLDTPAYFESRWTSEEFGKAKASEISILRLVWPNHSPTKDAGLSETIALSALDFDGSRLADHMLKRVADLTENLRARSIAARHLQITGKLQDEALIAGAKVMGAGAFRAVSIQLSNGEAVWVYPVVGVPTANIMNDIARKAMNANHGCPFLVYDEQGLSDQWLDHLEWLNTHIPEVDFMRVSEASNELMRRI